MVIQDDWYAGYFIPKGTLILPLSWSIHHDPNEYDRPDEFIPERWLDNEFGTKHIVQDEARDHRRHTYVFGASRRVCPGSHMGKNSLVCPNVTSSVSPY
jgi:cytochrome P450